MLRTRGLPTPAYTQKAKEACGVPVKKGGLDLAFEQAFDLSQTPRGSIDPLGEDSVGWVDGRDFRPRRRTLADLWRTNARFHGTRPGLPDTS
jgi:hypothetical protein